MTKPCPWDDCIYPLCNSAMGCEDDAHTTPLRTGTTRHITDHATLVTITNGVRVSERRLTPLEYAINWHHLCRRAIEGCPLLTGRTT